MSNASDDRARWAQISALLDDALDRPSSERLAFVASACGDDRALADEVLALLEAAEESPTFLDGAAADLIPPAAFDSLDGDADKSDESGAGIGPYRLTRLIGRGGMGAVYEAERIDGQFEQRVALKLLPAHGGDAVRKRLLLERQVLARLTHPCIARLLDGGVTDDGRPYFVMDLVDGEPISVYCRERQIGLHDRLGLVIAVCEAVHAAHRNLVVHRDLKPSNILVERPTDAPGGQVKLLDFGIAKVLDEVSEGDSAALTQTGERWMTPSYAAPEQIRGEATTTATDVYQIGVLLYELLTGAPPFTEPDSGPFDRQRAICDQAPVPPSRTTGRRKSTRTEAPGISPGRFRGDLDAIVLMALRKEPEARYASAEAMAEDLRRFLRREPVLARRGTARYRLMKFVQRNRAPVGISAAAALVLVFASVIYAVNLSKSRDLAQQAAETARAEATKNEQIVGFLVDIFSEADPDEQQGEAATVTEVLDRASRRILEELDGQPLEQAQLLRTLGEVKSKRGQYEEAERLLEAALERYVASGTTAGNERLATRRLLVGNLYEMRAYDRAEPVAREVQALTLASYGPAHPKTASANLLYGQVLLEQGRPEDAREFIDEGLRIARGLPDEAELLEGALHSQARLSRVLGRLWEAERAYRELLDRHAASGTDRSIEAAGLWNSVGYTLRLQERYEDARVAYESSLAITGAVYGDTHPNYLTTLNNLASVHFGMGQHADGIRVLDQKLALSKAAYPRPHWRLGSAYVGAAQGRVEAGIHAEAIPLLLEAESIWVASIGDDHSWTASARSLLSACYAVEGRTEDAEDPRARSLTVLRQAEKIPPAIVPRLEQTAKIYRSIGMIEIADEFDALRSRAEQGGT
ncbi:MAG: serine/threonine-protein kinase [Pseudomonadota bacterium]